MFKTAIAFTIGFFAGAYVVESGYRKERKEKARQQLEEFNSNIRNDFLDLSERHANQTIQTIGKMKGDLTPFTIDDLDTADAEAECQN